ncbi:unnamed protein product [Ostreobium quekettii]|uniref:Transmembrane protein n=1 Tax=Ostreobium quekettii TaxID=121088 RepID=A0A8S1JFQ6_9CHLO|nr:unnamed protein product [Ostreobium quekettii]
MPWQFAAEARRRCKNMPEIGLTALAVASSACVAARAFSSTLHTTGNSGSDRDPKLKATFNFLFYTMDGILAVVLLLCIMRCWLTKHKGYPNIGDLDCRGLGQGGKHHSLSRAPGSDTSATCGEVSCTSARTTGRLKSLGTLFVRAFIGGVGIVPTMGQAISETTSPVVRAPQGILVGSQALYFGLVTAMGRYKMKWRAKTDQMAIPFTLWVLIALATAQIGLLGLSVDGEDSDTLNVVHITGPAPILATVVAMWLYPLGYESERFKYRRDVAKWDSDNGSRVRLIKLLNAWYKIAIYSAVTALVWTYGVVLFLKTKNVYPLLSSVLAPLLSSIIGAIPPLSEDIEEVQSKCRGNCQTDVITIPIIGGSRSTSFILVHFNWRVERMRIERVHSIVEHSNWGGKRNRLLYDIADDGLMTEADLTGGEFHRRVKEYTKIVRSIGGWHNMSEKTVDMAEQIMDIIEGCPSMHEGHLRIFLFMRATMCAAFRASASRKYKDFKMKQRGVTSVETFVEDVTMGSVKSAFEIMCRDGQVLDASVADHLVASFPDRISRDVAAMLLVQMAANSGDNRVHLADTLADGSDVYLDYSFRTDSWDVHTLYQFKEPRSPIYTRCVTAGDVYGIFTRSNSQGLSGKSHLERASVECVPTTLTSFKVLRQHMLKYLMAYMGLSIIFVVFGQGLKK